MAVQPNPKLPKSPKKGKGSKSKGFSTEDLRNYLLLGGNLSDIAGNKITQGQVLSAIQDPATLQVILSSLSSTYGGGGAYDPNTTYTDALPTFEAQFNPVRDKYATVGGVEAQIVSDFFSSLDEGTDPDMAAANLLDKDFMKKTYGVDISKGPVATLTGKLTADAKKYQVAEQKRKAAVEKQNYEAWRKQTVDKGANFSEYLSKALGIPALAQLPDPSQAFTATPEEVAKNTALLAKINPNWGKTFELSKADIAAAKKYSEGIRSGEGRPDQITTDINKTFGVGEFAGQTHYVPTSILGQKIWGTGWLNKRIGEVAGSGVKATGAAFTMGGYNPFQGTAEKDELARLDKAAQEKAYKEFLGKSESAKAKRTEEGRRERVLRLAAQKIAARGAALQAQGITPFTQQLPSIQAILGGTSLPIVKD